MYQARYGCFETNSSSTHGIALLNKYELEQFNLGNIYVNFENLPELPRCGTFECYKALVLNPDDKYKRVRDEFCYDYKVEDGTIVIYDKDYRTGKLDKLEGDDLDEAVVAILRVNGVLQAHDNVVWATEDDEYPTPDGEKIVVLQADWES